MCERAEFACGLLSAAMRDGRLAFPIPAKAAAARSAPTFAFGSFIILLRSSIAPDASEPRIRNAPNAPFALAFCGWSVNFHAGLTFLSIRLAGPYSLSFQA